MNLPQLKHALFNFAVGLMLITWGCSKKEEAPAPTPENLKAVNPNDPAPAQQAARAATITAMRRGIAPPPPALKLKGGEPATPEVLAAYNQELLRASVQEGQSPENLAELERKWIRALHLLPPLPTPPPGKRIIYDQQNYIIRLDPP